MRALHKGSYVLRVALPTALLLRASSALAAPPVHVLGLDSDDAEEQADALTSALRTRLREMPNFALGEPNQPLSSLLTVLKCKGSAPDADCQSKIFAKLNSERFLWGSVQHDRKAHTVTAELHYAVKNMPSGKIHSETYPDSAKDPRDPVVQKVVSKMFAELLGAQPSASGLAKVRVSSGNYECGVLVDGEPRGQLVNGEIVLDLPPGRHTFELNKPCAKATTYGDLVIGRDNAVAISSSMEGKADPRDEKSSGTGRTILGVSLLAVGVGAGAVSTYYGFDWLSLKREANEKNCESDVKPENERRCSDLNRKMQPYAVFWGVAALGAAGIIGGIYFLVSKPSEEKASKLRLSPLLGAVQGASLSGSF